MSTVQSPETAERPTTHGGPKCTPAELLLKVVLAGTLTHYETRGMIDDKRLEHMLLSGKQILYKSHQESEVRYEALARMPLLWPHWRFDNGCEIWKAGFHLYFFIKKKHDQGC